MTKKNFSVTVIGFPYTNKDNSGRGIDRYLYCLINNLQKNGVNFQLLDEGIVKGNIFQLVHSTIHILVKLLKSKSSLYHAVDPIGAILALFLLKRPLITTIHDTIPLSSNSKLIGKFRFPFLKILMMVSLRLSDKIIVPFDITKNELSNRYGVIPDKITKVNYGIDLPLLTESKEKIVARKGEEIFRILFIGSSNPIARGLDVVIKVYEKISISNHKFSLTIIGNLTEVNNYISKHPQLNGDSNIEIFDFIPEQGIYSFMKTFDVFLYPSSLGFSYLAIQAMYMGLPTIVADARDMFEYIKDGGLICQKDSINCYVDSITRIIEDQEFRYNLIKRGHGKSMQFSGNKMALDTIKVYKEIINDRSILKSHTLR